MPDASADRVGPGPAGRSGAQRVGGLRALVALLALAILGIDVALPLGVAAGIPYVAVILLALRLPREREVVLFAAGCSVLALADLFLSPPAGATEIWKVGANRLLTLLAIWVTAGLGLQRRRAESAVDRLDERLRAIVETAPDAILTVRGDGAIESCNPAAEQIFGWPAQQLVGRSLALLVPELDAAGELEQLADSRAGRPAEIEARRRDGSVFPLELSVARQASLGLITLIARDLTERRAIEEQLLQAQKMEAVGTLAAGVAHDFNNLLTSIRGSSEILLGSIEPGSALVRDVERIRRAADRATALTTQLLGFSRRQVMHRSLLELGDAIRRMQGLLFDLLPDGVERRLELAPAALHVRADEGQLLQALMNLVINASDAMLGEGRLSLETAAESLDGRRAAALGLAPGEYATICVRDTGSGIPAGILGRVFEPFFTTKEPGRGTGLGLATVFGIAARHGGAVGVETREGEGTSFTLYLPRAERPLSRPADPPLETGARPQGGQTILLVDDDELVRELAAEVLESEGYSVLQSTTAEQAIDRHRRHSGPIDLLVTDVILPGASGLVLARQLRATQPGLRVLYMSGYADQGLADRDELDPAAALVRKPFSNAALCEKVRSVLGA